MNPEGAIIFLPRESGGQPPLLLEELLFAPGAVWLREGLKALGVERFFLVCHADDRAAAAALFPDDTQCVTTDAQDADRRLADFLSGQTGQTVVVTQPVLLTPDGQASGGGGLWTIGAADLMEGLNGGAAFPDALRAKGQAAPWSALPLTAENRVQAEQLARDLSVRRLLEGGVRVMDPAAVYADPTVIVGRGTALLPGTILRGNTVIGADCEIGPHSMIRDCVIGDRVTVNASQLNESIVESGTVVGPFAYVRPHCHVGKDVKVGDFVELKNSTIGDGTKISHLTYVGDSDVGSRVNFGCGTVTVNYDGANKFRTVIGDNAFIGCNSNLVAPVRIGEGAYTAAGSTITDDVPADSLAIARAKQSIKVQWAAKRRKAKTKR